MVHEREGLPLGLEAGDDAFGVHAELDDLEGDSAADRFFLFGHIDDAATAFADLLEEFIATDLVAGFFGEREGDDDSPIRRRSGRWFEKTTGLFMRLEQIFHALAEWCVLAAGLLEVLGAFRCAELQRGVKNGFGAVRRRLCRPWQRRVWLVFHLTQDSGKLQMLKPVFGCGSYGVEASLRFSSEFSGNRAAPRCQTCAA